MSDIPARLMVAYGMIAFLLVAGLSAILWARHNTWARRDARNRIRTNERYERNRKAAAEASSAGEH